MRIAHRNKNFILWFPLQSEEDDSSADSDYNDSDEETNWEDEEDEE